MTATEMARVCGYSRASTDKQIASPETQRQIIEDYAKRLGRTVDRFFIDPAVSGKKSLFDREAGKELPLILKRGHSGSSRSPQSLLHRLRSNPRILDEAQDHDAPRWPSLVSR